MKKTKAFTLVELLVVIAIIAVLLAILLPSLASVKELASRIKCGNSFKGIGMAMKFYGDTYDGRLPQLEYRPGTQTETQQHPYWAFRDTLASDPTKWALTINFGCLYRSNLIQNPITFYCPADVRWKDSMKSYATNGTWGDKVPTLPVNDPFISDNPDPAQRPDASTPCVRLNIAYWPQSRKLLKDATRVAQIQREDLYELGFPDIAYKVADLDSNKAYSSDNGGHALGGTVSGGSRSKGQNALFGDGHVIFGAPPKDPMTGVTYRIRQEMESSTAVTGNVMPRTNRYFFYLQP
jgi:prepilin-type N-terminal cleavage/methylation domain-containing protein/prepilin-type processing-associated H-X9-DG protein